MKLTLRTLKYTLMLLLAAVSLLPIIWMVFGSFRPYQELFKYSSSLSPHILIPVEFTWKNYQNVIFSTRNPFLRFIGNTLWVAGAVTAAVLLINSMAAFAFAKLRFRWKPALFALFMSAMIIPGEVTLVPNYLLMHDLGWLNSYKALIIPSMLSVFGIFMLRQFFAEIPDELLEAARMDGASLPRTFLSVVLPAAVPALITLGLMTFLGNWDSYLWPLIVINDHKMQMIQVAIAAFSSTEGTDWSRILAANTISTVPILLLFLFLQRYYIQGITMSGIKG
ncbi:carbohydrate ABC transporter permease [Paenibacillus mucilaginosus]|uniref:Carbohydrate ABC transporter permease n=1 Tax=Paenibacillus mucilaginosus (strain KNP414) TaxID=1036673 RepID=F8FRH1_PAEMK|nr:carbohydrate ABC transporter permease [Paenibacillus mucilaginosus]AEI40528.1 carbohydrate ABC transporter permease [Paenibacillus mucilaginosus KNP414]MCG7216330.1 carbohydrate ABC transporter permease [Paenibacillus mucilaginosus]WDM29696.1 carbohydrate ABC transporter permease [Paenibacillus mucilaginosus]